MKYIRTKDEVLEYEKAIENIKYWFHNVAFEDDEYNIDTETDRLNKSIIKQADTIEKLIDELVVHNPSNDGEFSPKHFVYRNKWETMLKPISDYQKSKGIEIYGAIWTDKGLIYVAKMNEKGKLELL